MLMCQSPKDPGLRHPDRACLSACTACMRKQSQWVPCCMQPDAVQLPTFYAEDTAASANEVWSRIHSDPLFAVRACTLLPSGPNHTGSSAPTWL